jgi:uncharacterized protein
MSSRTPDFLDPWQFADLEKRISGTRLLASFPRLSQALADTAGQAEYELKFSRDEKRRACINGFVKATLTLQCQRCLGLLAWPVHAEINLIAVAGLEEAERLPETVEPLLLTEARMCVSDLLEDELLLSLPQVPKHGPGECATDNRKTDRLATGEEGSAQTPNPFAKLAELKTTQS